MRRDTGGSNFKIKQEMTETQLNLLQITLMSQTTLKSVENRVKFEDIN